jgi:hypothetical protein
MESLMTARRVTGLILVVVGLVVLLWGGVFWKDRDTVVDAGPIQVATEQRKGVNIPPAIGGACIAVGLVLVVLPPRSRA